MEARRILIVASVTAGEEHLREIARARMAEAPASFVLLVPSVPPVAGFVWTEGEAYALAAERMENGLASLRDAGARVEGLLGDIRVMDAISDALRAVPFDEVIVSTLPAGYSRWLGQNLPRRVHRRFRVPVTHVIARLPLRNAVDSELTRTPAAV
jgi:hypothetical protein